MNDVYQTPNSELEDPGLPLVAMLKKEQSYVIGIISGFFASLGTLLLLETVGGRIIILCYLLPAFVSGFVIKFLARPFTSVLRIVCAISAALPVFLVFSIGLGSGLNLFSVLISLLSILICFAIARRSLSYEQERILYRLRRTKSKA